LRENEFTFQAAMYIVKVAASFLEERTRNEPLFDLIVDSFLMLKSGVSPVLVTRMFDVRFADIEGILPVEEFSKAQKKCVGYLKNGSFDAADISASELRALDSILVPCLSDHLGKDIRLWKSM